MERKNQRYIRPPRLQEHQEKKANYSGCLGTLLSWGQRSDFSFSLQLPVSALKLINSVRTSRQLNALFAAGFFAEI